MGLTTRLERADQFSVGRATLGAGDGSGKEEHGRGWVGSTYKQHPVKSQQLIAQNGKVVATHQPDCAARDCAMVVATWTISFSDDSMQESVGYSAYSFEDITGRDCVQMPTCCDRGAARRTSGGGACCAAHAAT